MDVKKLFGENVRLHRRGRGLTQEKLAELIGVSAKHLGVIERGEAFVSAEILEKLAASLSVPVSTLFYSETEKYGSATFLQKVDGIIEKELLDSVSRIKTKIRG